MTPSRSKQSSCAEDGSPEPLRETPGLTGLNSSGFIIREPPVHGETGSVVVRVSHRHRQGQTVLCGWAYFPLTARWFGGLSQTSIRFVQRLQAIHNFITSGRSTSSIETPPACFFLPILSLEFAVEFFSLPVLIEWFSTNPIAVPLNYAGKYLPLCLSRGNSGFVRLRGLVR